jgi:hypothetical protein
VGVTVNSGANQSFTISPAAGFHVASVLVDGVSQGAVTTFTFNNVTCEPHISAVVRDQHVHDHGVRGRGRLDLALGLGHGELRGQPDVHDHAERPASTS